MLITALLILSMHFHFLGHLSNSGDLLLWAGVRRRQSSVMRRALTCSTQELLLKNFWANLNQIYYVASVW